MASTGTTSKSVQPDPEPGTVLFLGSLDWRPNLDAVGLLLDRIFPAVRAAEPAPGCAWSAAGLLRRSFEKSPRLPGVELHADVPDVRPFLATSGAHGRSLADRRRLAVEDPGGDGGGIARDLDPRGRRRVGVVPG